jgi:EAL domain-containing protein (putative c-di-GMP-specific phosphodiesterase class I)
LDPLHVVHYRDKKFQEVLREKEYLRDLIQAVQEGNLSLHYQPIVGLKHGRIEAVEALVYPRGWRPEESLDADINKLEKANATQPIWHYVAGEAVRQIARWNEILGEPRISICVNIAANQLESVDLVGEINQDTVELPEFDNRQLVLELSERQRLADKEHTHRQLRTLADKGFTLALDDFGVENSSLERLVVFPYFSQLKLDRQIVRYVAVDQTARVVAHHIIRMAHELELVVTAEGIESEEQAHILRQLGCDRGQGSLFGMRMTEWEITKLLKKETDTS